MRKILSLLCVVFVLSWSVLSFAGSSSIASKEGQLRELNAVLQELETHYGMIQFKENLYGVTYEQLREKYSQLINNAQTLEEATGIEPAVQRSALTPDQFRQLIVALGAEFRDGHLNILRNSANNWTLGIRAAEINGRLFVTSFNKNFFISGNSLPDPKAGDEIMAVNGKPVSEWAQKYLPYMSLATYSTRYASALESIINHGHRRLPVRNAGESVQITFARPGLSQTFTGTYQWINTKDYSKMSAYMPPNTQPASGPGEFIYGQRGTRSYFKVGLENMKLAPGNVVNIGVLYNLQIEEAKKKLDALLRRFGRAENHNQDQQQPLDLQTLEALNSEMSAEEKAAALAAPVTRLEAYTIRHKGKNLGVIRIPDYSPSTFQDMANEIRWLTGVLKIFEGSTDALVIDQLSNGGGYVWGVSQLTRLFANKEQLRGVTIDMKLTETLLNSLESWSRSRKNSDEPLPQVAAEGDDDEDLLNTKKNFAQIYLNQKYVDELRKRMEEGNGWSGAIPYMGTDTDVLSSNEHGRIVGREGKVYSKPILLLNDSRSASGGDFFPSLMQANKRAVVFGETSMGLGGPVFRQTQTPGSEMFMRCTFGYCERPDGLPIENVGVVPDVQRWVTQDDLVSGFKNFTSDALDTAVSLAGGSNVATLRTEQASRRAPTYPQRENFRQLRELFNGMQTIADSQRTAAELTREYRSFFELTATVDTKDFSANEWNLLELPLPAILTSRDVVLASLRYRDAVVERLNEMQRLPRFQSEEDLKALMNLISSELGKLGQVRFNPCVDALAKKK